MNTSNRLTLSTSPQTQHTKNLYRIANLALRQRRLHGKPRLHNTGKESDSETGLYYFGARYLDPKTGRWLSGDPALGEYLPSAPVSEEARKRNGNLPGMGGVFNYVNLHVYHYAGNNPVKYVDPDGMFLIASRSANQYAKTYPRGLYQIQGMATLLVEQGNIIAPFPIDLIKMMYPNYKLQIGNGLDNALRDNITSEKIITATAHHIGQGVYQIDLQVTTVITNPETGSTFLDIVTGDIAYATTGEVGAVIAGGNPDQRIVNSIVNKILEIAEINIRITE